MDLTNTINNACAHNFDAASWLRFVDSLVTDNDLEYSSNEEDDAWINVMNDKGEQVFFCGRSIPLLFAAGRLPGVERYPHPMEVVIANDWWSADYSINLDALACLTWHTDEIDPAAFSLLDFVYATH
ncbi:hypothetical protein MKQ68_04420 [Chitinophaga horti]|uniref:DUF2750 domain-containing protein n=1 Tax=Chitinophaga horti TaxID=2920382 RepID=A0ABY6J419_9BACT|nr:hypothetical protein [Chitinophaga horti]UYQ94333.1 hypothetical protein MKQ68_04420 [Chitinophaga horti]